MFYNTKSKVSMAPRSSPWHGHSMNDNYIGEFICLNLHEMQAVPLSLFQGLLQAVGLQIQCGPAAYLAVSLISKSPRIAANRHESRYLHNIQAFFMRALD